MATFKPVVFSKHLKSDGTSNIKIRIYHNQDSQYIATYYYIEPIYMSSSGEVLSESPGADMLNYELTNIIQGYRKNLLKLGSVTISKMTCKDLRNYLEAMSATDSDIIDFVAFSRGIIAVTKKEKTRDWYQVSLNVLIWHFGKEKINVKELTPSYFKEFINQLKKQGSNKKPLSPGSISNYLRGIRALHNKARLHYNDEDLDIIRIPGQPFKKVNIPEYKKKRKNISIDEIKMIRDIQVTTEREEIGRDVFMMQFYLMGININDLYLLSHPVGKRLEYERSKTITEDKENFMLSIKIEPELQVLLNKYCKNGFLSVIKERYNCSYNLMKAANKGLKKICETLEMKKITTNWSRHSWASIARNKAGASKADVDFCLGHVNNDYKMADIYIEIDYSIYDTVNRQVLDLLK